MTELTGNSGELEPAKWVSVKERLPEVPIDRGFIEVIIASYAEHRNLRVSGTAYFSGGNFYDHCDDQILIDDPYWELTHWCYLPSPPEVSDEITG